MKILIPRNENGWKCEFGSAPDCVSERLDRGKQYLLFLREDPRSGTLRSTYMVESGETYYRAVLGYRGAVRLPTVPDPTFTPNIVAVTALCNALEPPDMPSKIARLKALSAAADARWRDSVDAAISALEAAQSTPHQSRLG